MRSAIFNFQEEEINHPFLTGFYVAGNSEPIDPPTQITIENNVIEFVLDQRFLLAQTLNQS